MSNDFQLMGIISFGVIYRKINTPNANIVARAFCII